MRLSTHIFFGIVGITVLSQVVFGLIAYWMVVNGGLEHQQSMLAAEARELAEDLAVPLAVGELSRTLAEERLGHLAPDIDLLLIENHRTNRRFLVGPWAEQEGTDLLLSHILQKHRQGDQSGGRLQLNGTDVLWAGIAVTGTPYDLILLDRPRDMGWGSTLATRFLAVGALILWVAVWVALVLATVISRKLNEKSAALRHQVTHDVLTGLPNRALLYERLEEALDDPDHGGVSVALLVIDIDRFKEINDTLGHHFGDRLLLEVGARLKALLEKGESVARLGGDEFAVLLPDATGRQALERVERILAEMKRPVMVDDIELEVRVTVGVALHPEHAADLDTLVRYADVAMFQAREKGLSHMFYDGAADNFSVRRLRLGAELRSAIARGEMCLHFQPKVQVDSGRVVGVEALVRWNHPTLGLIPPDEFIPLAEQTGAITPLTLWVIEQGLKSIGSMRELWPGLGLAVNISTQNLRDPDFLPVLVEALRNFGFEAEDLTLEITESVMMQDLAHARSVLQGLHDRGIRISVDDFGTGYSSFAYLTQLPLNELKIDRSFVRDMARKRSQRTLVHSVVELAHHLGCTVVAEGVEEEEALGLLRAMGCDVAQGYHLSRPLPEEQLRLWLRTWAARRNDASSDQAITASS